MAEDSISQGGLISCFVHINTKKSLVVGNWMFDIRQIEICNIVVKAERNHIRGVGDAAIGR